MIDLTNKHALIAGGMNKLTGGITARLQVAGAGVTLAHSPADQAKARQLANENGAKTQTFDFDQPKNLADQFNALDSLDIAIITPRWYETADFTSTSASDWNAALRENFEQMTLTAQAAAAKMIQQAGEGRGGRIIFLSSVASLLPLLETSVVGTSLAALRPIAKMAAVDLGKHGITVNIVAAGWVETEHNEAHLQAGHAQIEAGIPAGRIGTPEQIGDACCFLASDLAAYITGVVLPVDGGYLLTPAAGNTPYPS